MSVRMKTMILSEHSDQEPVPTRPQQGEGGMRQHRMLKDVTMRYRRRPSPNFMLTQYGDE